MEFQRAIASGRALKFLRGWECSDSATEIRMDPYSWGTACSDKAVFRGHDRCGRAIISHSVRKWLAMGCVMALAGSLGRPLFAGLQEVGPRQAFEG